MTPILGRVCFGKKCSPTFYLLLLGLLQCTLLRRSYYEACLIEQTPLVADSRKWAQLEHVLVRTRVRAH